MEVNAEMGCVITAQINHQYLCQWRHFSQFKALSKFYELRNPLGSYYILSFKETVKIFLQQLNIKINITQSRAKNSWEFCPLQGSNLFIITTQDKTAVITIISSFDAYMRPLGYFTLHWPIIPLFACSKQSFVCRPNYIINYWVDPPHPRQCWCPPYRKVQIITIQPSTLGWEGKKICSFGQYNLKWCCVFCTIFSTISSCWGLQLCILPWGYSAMFRIPKRTDRLILEKVS